MHLKNFLLRILIENPFGFFQNHLAEIFFLTGFLDTAEPSLGTADLKSILALDTKFTIRE